jgi:hypothetical protein
MSSELAAAAAAAAGGWPRTFASRCSRGHVRRYKVRQRGLPSKCREVTARRKSGAGRLSGRNGRGAALCAQWLVSRRAGVWPRASGEFGRRPVLVHGVVTGNAARPQRAVNKNFTAGAANSSLHAEALPAHAALSAPIVAFFGPAACVPTAGLVHRPSRRNNRARAVLVVRAGASLQLGISRPPERPHPPPSPATATPPTSRTVRRMPRRPILDICLRHMRLP